jgi:anti-sigma regulatory factor (Ser/Thr protein kinase)
VGDKTEVEFRASLPTSPSSPASSRSLLDKALHESAPAPTLETARLLTTELVANAVVHALVPDGMIGLSLRQSSDAIRVEVEDEGTGFADDERAPNLDLGSGWGLWLVGELASRWGVLHDPFRVWFELDT